MIIHRRITLIAIAVALLAGAGASCAAGPLRPGAPFDRATAPPPPDYENASSWSALPDREDAADVTPRGSIDKQSSAAVDVFFVHPTTYLLGTSWNAAVDDADINQRTDNSSIRHQASVFNSAGRVYAPRYRQAILYAFTGAGASGFGSRELAYGDVLRAFDHYLSNHSNGRPFILAGHSQGAHHVLRLLEERINGRPLGRRLVAAYLIGLPLAADKLGSTLDALPLCTEAAQTGCIVSWNTVSPKADRGRFGRVSLHYPDGWQANGSRPLVCVNPLSWTADGDSASAQIPMAAVVAGRNGLLRRVAGPAQARCDRGLLAISRPESNRFRLTAGRKGDYHVYDIPLFHLNLRRNAVQRASAFLSPG